MGVSMSYLNWQRSIGQKVERARIRKLMQMSCTKTTKEETIGSGNCERREFKNDPETRKTDQVMQALASNNTEFGFHYKNQLKS